MIGVFDSGSGGLTVMRALERMLPRESLVYLGDHRNTPYGDRPPDEIYRLVREGVETLFNCGCSLVLIACNTAAAEALRELQRSWLPITHPTKRVIGVVVPVVEAITGVPWDTNGPAAASQRSAQSLHVGIFATSHTVRSGIFAREIVRRAPNVRVSEQACPDLARLIDLGASEEVISTRVRAYVAELLCRSDGKPDMCVLACTHYPIVEHIFVDALPPGIRLLSQAEVTAASLKLYLQRHPRFSSAVFTEPTYITTGLADHVSMLASRYYGRAVQFRSC